jgi:hypothetical protein
LVVLVDELEHPVLSYILRKRENKRRKRLARNFSKEHLVDALALTHSNPPSSEAASWPISLVCRRLRPPWHQRK